MNEAETRAEHVDPALQAAGWGVVEGSRIRREFAITLGRLEGHGRRGKSLTADYVLEYRNTKLAVVEAKAWDEELTEGVAQAKNYAGMLAVAEMQKMIDAVKSDLFDVLANVAYALPPLTHEQRAAKAKIEISTHFSRKQQVFLDFVLSHYVTAGVDELSKEKLTPLLRLKYRDSISDAIADLGEAKSIRRTFAGFQKYLYDRGAA